MPGNCDKNGYDNTSYVNANGSTGEEYYPRHLPAISFVTPGGCDDMHDCSVKVGDDWLKEWVPVIQRSAAYQNGELAVFITWDEGSGSDLTAGETCWDAVHADSGTYPSCHVATIVMSPYTTRPGIG